MSKDIGVNMGLSPYTGRRESLGVGTCPRCGRLIAYRFPVHVCIKRITRKRKLTAKEGARLQKIREQVEKEFPPKGKHERRRHSKRKQA